MKAIVVYESLWGNTAAIARAIAAGIGPEAQALSTAEATAEAIAGAGLIVAGAPLIAFSLPSEKTREGIRTNPRYAAKPPDFSHPSLAAWLEALPTGQGRSAAFETRIWWSPGGATGAYRARAGARGIPFCCEGAALHRKRHLRPVARRRAGTRPTLGSRACKNDGVIDLTPSCHFCFCHP